MGMTRRIATAALFLLAVLLVWTAVTQWFGWVSSIRFPTPGEALRAFEQIAVQGYSNGRLHQHVLQSVMLVTLSFSVSVSLGIVLGIAMGANRRLEILINPIFSTLRPIPPLAWIPLAIVWLGLENSAKVMVIFVAAFVPAVINTFALASLMRSASACELKPPKTTECAAPMRAHESIATTASGIIGR